MFVRERFRVVEIVIEVRGAFLILVPRNARHDAVSHPFRSYSNRNYEKFLVIYSSATISYKVYIPYLLIFPHFFRLLVKLG